MTHLEIKVNTTHIFEFKRYDESGQIIPTSGSYDIIDNSGSTIETGSLVIDSDGTMEATFTNTNNTNKKCNFKLAFSFIHNSKTTYDNILFDVVETPLQNLTTDKDLFVYIGVLRDRLFEKGGTSSAIGTIDTLIDSSLSSDSRDWYGARLQLKDGVNSDSRLVDARITAYDVLTGTITFSPSLVTATSEDQSYQLRQSYQTTIDDAFDLVRQDVRNKVGLSSGYIDSNIINTLVTYKALEIISRNNREEQGDKWDLWSLDYDGMYGKQLQKINEPFDTNGDGSISDQENRERPTFGTSSIIR